MQKHREIRSVKRSISTENALPFHVGESKAQYARSKLGTTAPFRSSLNWVESKVHSVSEVFGEGNKSGHSEENVDDSTSAQTSISQTNQAPTKSLEDRQAEMKKQFEESLDEEDVKNLPVIQVLQVFEATERAPAIDTSDEVETSEQSAEKATTTTTTTTTTTPPPPTISLSNIVFESSSTESELSSSLTSLTNTKEEETMFIKKPSAWNKLDRRFQGIRTRRFIGSTEVPHSIFNDSMIMID